MISLLIQKELRSIILSPKFVATFVVCSLLLLLSISIGILEYRQSIDQYNTATSLAKQRMERQTSWNNVAERIYRKPNPLGIFVSGLNYDIGRWSEVSPDAGVKLEHSPYSDDPVFAVFRMVDFAFIVQIVLSLFAILFTYDAVNGERERGTLRLVFSNAVSRSVYILGKIIGSWLGLVVPVSIPILLSLLLVQLTGVPVTGAEWGRIAMLVLIALMYVTLFIVVGVLISTVTRRSSVSFLVSLVIWVAFVLVIPRAGVMAAGSIVDVPSLAEIEGIRDGYAKDLWNKYYEDSEQRWLAMEKTRSDNPEDEVDQEARMWKQMKQEDSARKVVQRDIDAYEVRVKEDWQNRKRAQQRLGLALSRLSPASTFQLTAMTLAGSDIGLKDRYESSMSDFRSKFNSYVAQKQAESGQPGGVMIQFDSEKGFNIKTSRDDAGLDLSDKPEFEHPKVTTSNAIEATAVNYGLLSFVCLIGFAGAFVSFLKFDVR